MIWINIYPDSGAYGKEYKTKGNLDSPGTSFNDAYNNKIKLPGSISIIFNLDKQQYLFTVA
jgi:hypothetical protein